MELLLALLMTVAAVSYPLFVDIRRHGTNNILQITAQDIAAWGPIAAVLAAFVALGRGVQRAVVISISFVILGAVVWLLFKIIGWLL